MLRCCECQPVPQLSLYIRPGYGCSAFYYIRLLTGGFKFSSARAWRQTRCPGIQHFSGTCTNLAGEQDSVRSTEWTGLAVACCWNWICMMSVWLCSYRRQRGGCSADRHVGGLSYNIQRWCNEYINFLFLEHWLKQWHMLGHFKGHPGCVCMQMCFLARRLWFQNSRP